MSKRNYPTGNRPTSRLRGRYLWVILLASIAVLIPITAQVTAQAAQPVLDAGALHTDPRYGFGGRSTEGIDYLGIPIYRRWGEDGNADALAALERGATSYFVVGKTNMRGYTRRNEGVNWLQNGPQCHLPGDNAGRNATRLPCTEVPHAGIPNHSDWEQIPELAAQYPGQIWEIANEPDWNPYFTPEQYAVWFHLYAQRIRQVDPTARIMIGGLLMCCGEGVYEHFQLRRSDWDTQIAQANHRHAWITRFWYHYRSLYGDYPRVDIWNIHPYAQASGAVPFDAQRKADATIQRIRGFLDFLPTLPSPVNSPSEASKPIYITELGVLGSEGSIVRGEPCAERGCLTQAEFEREEAHAIAYMDLILGWLEDEPRITRWYWFHWNWDPNLALDHIGNLNTFANARYSFFQNADAVNRAAIRYAQRAGSPLLFNTSFETHDTGMAPYGWGFWAGGPGEGYWHRIDGERSVSGDKSVRLHAGGQAGQYGHLATLRQPIYSQHYNGQLARVQAICRTGDSGRAQLKVNPTNAQGTRNTNWAPGMSARVRCDGWQPIRTEWFVLPADTISFEVELLVWDANGEAWFDDVELILAGDLDRSLAVDQADLTLLGTTSPTARQAQQAGTSEGAAEVSALHTASGYVHNTLIALLARMTQTQ